MLIKGSVFEVVQPELKVVRILAQCRRHDNRYFGSINLLKQLFLGIRKKYKSGSLLPKLSWFSFLLILHYTSIWLVCLEVKHTTAKKETEWTGSRNVTFVIII